MIALWRSLAPLGRAVVGGLVIVVMILALVTVRSCQSATTAKTEARLGQGQTGAAIASGQDAVATLGKAEAAEAAIDTITEENHRAIHQAPGADDRIDAALDAAGRRGLCRRAAYRGRPECLQFPAAD